ncbi:MAG TPA: thiamine pyrophosphate-binding protein [Candidatus Limnocylindrales bacterium]|nr:thiamine pyrophosphate-binding protein [Candidatus Limnocylindrales bacterium]
MIETEGMTGADTLLRVLAQMGIDRIFSSPGSEWAPVWEAFAKAKAQSEGVPLYISSRHEEVAVGMASGYAKSTGKLPAVMIHTTVGALHATMALRGALHEQIPMVVFTGESLGFGEEAGPDVGAQWLGALADIGGPARLVERCVKWSYGVNAKSLLPSTIQRACQLAMSAPKGPVFVSLPMEYLFDKMTKNAAAENVAIPAPVADPAAVEDLAALLAGAKNPLIITEEAGRDPAVVEKLVELAEVLGAGVVESRASSYVNFPRTHPLHAGFEPQEFLQEADAILLLGVVVPWHPASKKLNPATKIAVLSDNPLRSELPYWGFPVSQIVTGDIDSSMKHLLDAVKRKLNKGNNDAARHAEIWRGRHEARRASWKEDAVRRQEQKPLDTRWVTYELAQVIPPDAIVVEETITHRLSIHRYLDMLKPGSFFAGCIGGLGTGTGTALGVKAANPKRPVLCLIGDGAFNYDPGLAALGVCQEHNLPIMIVLYNNYGYHSQKSGVPRFFPDGFAVKNQDFIGISINPSPDYAMIARAFEGYGEKVEEPGEVRAALQRGLKALAGGQMALIDLRLAKAAEMNERPDRAN